MLWESNWEALSKDIEHTPNWILKFQTPFTPSQKRKCTLIEIEKQMGRVGKSLKEYPGIEVPSIPENEIENRLINEEMNYDKDKLRGEHVQILSTKFRAEKGLRCNNSISRSIIRENNICRWLWWDWKDIPLESYHNKAKIRGENRTYSCILWCRSTSASRR
jgi:hypothetical protein